MLEILNWLNVLKWTDGEENLSCFTWYKITDQSRQNFRDFFYLKSSLNFPKVFWLVTNANTDWKI